MTDTDERDLVQWLRSYFESHPSISHLSVGLDAGYSSNGFVSAVLRGEKNVPLDRLGDWIRGLKLTGRNREWFVLLVHMQHTPEWARDQFWRLYDRISSTERREQQHQRDLLQFRESLAKLEAELLAARREKAVLQEELDACRRSAGA